MVCLLKEALARVVMPNRCVRQRGVSVSQLEGEWRILYGVALSVFPVALEQLDRDSLRAANEADANARPDVYGFPGELNSLRPDLGCDRIDVLHRQPEMVEPLIRGDRWR